MKFLFYWRTIGILFLMLAVRSSAWAYYVTVDDFSMNPSGATEHALKGGDIYYRQMMNITNTGTETLSDVGVVCYSVISGNTLSYNNGSHRWERGLVVNGTDYGLHWVKGYTYDPIEQPGGVNEYFTLNADEVPVYWLGDLDAGEKTAFGVYFAQNASCYTGGGWGFQPVFSCIAEGAVVPIPAAVLLMGSGLGILGLLRYRSRMYE